MRPPRATVRGRFIPLLALLLLPVLAPSAATAAPCDLDGDGDVDRSDILLILLDRRTPVGQSACGPACDIDGDGRITVLDARRCVFGCTLPRCAEPSAPTDSDNDGVADGQDRCPGFDDRADADGDGIPDGCDPLTDVDRDGVALEEGDCNDGDPAIHPGAAEVPNNDIDENCDGRLGVEVGGAYVEYDPADSEALCAEREAEAAAPPLFKAFPAHEFALINHRLVGITDEGADLILEVLADVVNLDTGRFRWVNARAMPLEVEGVSLLYHNLSFMGNGTVGPLATVPADPTNPVRIRVPKESASTVVGAVLNGCLAYDLRGNEVREWLSNVYEMDAATIEAYSFSDSDKQGKYAEFKAMGWTELLETLQPGDLIVFVEEVKAPCGPGDPGTKDCLHDLSAPNDPWEVVELQDVYGAPRLYYIERSDLELSSLVYSGYIGNQARFVGDGMHQSRWDWVEGNKVPYEQCEEMNGYPVADPDGTFVCEFRGRYSGYNDLFLGANTWMQGGVNFGAVIVDVGVRFREGLPKEAGAEITISHESSVVVHADDAETTDEWEQTLWSFAIPLGYLGNVVDVDLELTATVGGSSSFGAAGSFGLSYRGTYGVNMYADLTSAPYAVSVTPIVETEPVLYSDPTLGDAGAASARIWTGLDAQLTTVSGSVGLPSVRGRAWAQLDVTPGEDPWWSTSTGVDLGGTFALELFGIEILGHDFDLEDLAVERIARAGAPAFGGDPDVAAGETLRWARDIHVADSVYGDVPVDVLHLGGGELLVVERSGTAVLRLDAQGNVLWTTSSNTSGLAGAIPFDGGILMVGGSYRRLWTRELDPDGNPVGRNYVLTPDDLFGLHGVLPFDDAGKVGFIAYGYIGGRAFVARLSYDPSADEQPLTAVWAKSFRFGGGPFGGGVIVDQGVVLANMGNVLKLDMDGNVVWTTAVEAEWGREFRALAVLPDGDIVAVGGIARPVLESYRYQSAWVARFDGETGHLRQERTLGEDLCPRGIRPFFGGSGPGCIQAGYTTPGSSIYDTLYDLAVLPDGSLVATGKTSISEMRNLWVVRLSPTDLRVVWHVTVSGKGWDEGVSVTDAGDGIAVLGQTTSPAHKGLGESTDFPDLLLLKLPYDGGLRFARGTGMQLDYNKPDMVRPWGALGAIRNPPYTVQDVDLGTAVSENPTFSHGPAEVYDLDPW